MEDEIFIAMDVEDAGFDRIETVSSCRAAEEWLIANDPDFVVMDIELTDVSLERLPDLCATAISHSSFTLVLSGRCTRMPYHFPRAYGWKNPASRRHC
jgi:hypothetical protein